MNSPASYVSYHNSAANPFISIINTLPQPWPPMVQTSPPPSNPPSLYPCHLSCYVCGKILPMPPPSAADKFFCPTCHLHPNPSTSLPAMVHGIDPYKMQVVCVNCMAILNLPPLALGCTSTHFKCPICHLRLPSYIFPVDPSSTLTSPVDQLNKVVQDVGNGEVNNATATDTVVGEEDCLTLTKDMNCVREFEKVEDRMFHPWI